jgi:hypothetical protein
MSFEKDATGITFYCDTSDCESVLTYDISVSSGPPGTDFIACLADAKERFGWVSLKRIGRPWDFFCKNCALGAAIAHSRFNEQENERERIKARNAQ